MRYRLRTLLIVLAIGPPLLAGAWFGCQRVAEYRRKSEFDRLINMIQTTIKPETWDGVGGPGNIDQFSGTLDIVVGPGQVVHEQPEPVE